MRRLYIYFLVVVFASFFTANAQVSLPNNNNSLSGAGSNAGADIFNSYKNKLKNNVPSKSSSTNLNKITPRTRLKPQVIPKSTPKLRAMPPVAHNPPVIPPIKPKTRVKPSKPNLAAKHSSKRTNPAAGLTQGEIQQVTNNVERRVGKLSSTVSTRDLSGIINYVKALHTIIKFSDAQAGNADISAILNKLGDVSNSQISSEMSSMLRTQRELNVLQVVRREVGSKAMVATIDDYRDGGGKLKRALAKAKDKLRDKLLGARTTLEKSRIKRVIDMLDKHANADIPNKIFKAVLAPLTFSGRFKKGLSGKNIANMLETTDDYEWEYGEDEGENDTPGADIIGSGKR